MISKATKRKIENYWHSQCVIYGNMDFLEFHHMIPKTAGGTDDYDNIILLCACCHSKIHNRTYNPAKYKQCTSIDYEAAQPILAAYFAKKYFFHITPRPTAILHPHVKYTKSTYMIFTKKFYIIYSKQGKIVV